MRFKRLKQIMNLGILLLLAGCASNPDKIAASSVSPLQYQEYDCKQLASELDRISRKTNEIYYRLNKEAGADSAQMAIGLVLFWPALFFLEGGDGPEAAEYAQLKGELETIEKVSIQKKCGLNFPEEPKKEEIKRTSSETNG